MKLISLLCLLATSSFFAGKVIPTKDIDPCKKEAAAKTQTGKSGASICGEWAVEKLHHVTLGKYSMYERGKSNNTNVHYDNLRFIFYEDGTGVHTDQYKVTYPLSWKFTSPDKSALEVTVAGTTNKWDMLFITDKYLFTSAQLNISGNTDNLETLKLVRINTTPTNGPLTPTTDAVRSKTQILADNTWLVEEVKSNVSGNNLHFRKGKNNSTGADYSIYSLTFNVDGTGTYTDGTGYTHQTIWAFTSKDEHNMRLNLSSGDSYDWSMVEISENSFQSITELHIDGHDLIQSTRYVPKKPECKTNPGTLVRN